MFAVGRQRVALKEFLDPVAPGDSPYRLPPVSQPNARAHVARELKRLKAGGRICGLMGYGCRLLATMGVEGRCHCPCLTKSRTRGLWLLARGRRLTADEALRLQGFDVDHWSFRMSSAQKFAAAGNAMSVSVLLALFPPLLQAAGLDCLVQGGTRSDGNDPRGGREHASADGRVPARQHLDEDGPGDDREPAGADNLVLDEHRCDGDVPRYDREHADADVLVQRRQQLDGDDPGGDRKSTGVDDLVLEGNSVTGMIPEAISFLHHTLRLKAGWVPW